MTNLKRRTFIKGFGLAMGLPLLDAMSPATRALAAQSGFEIVIAGHHRARITRDGSSLPPSGPAENRCRQQWRICAVSAHRPTLVPADRCR